MWRQLAQRCDVERYYLVAGEKNSLLVQQAIEEDQKSQLQSRSISIKGWNEPSQVPLNDLWLIDESVVVRQDLGAAEGASWLVSGHATEVEHAQRVLWRLSEAQLAQDQAASGPHPSGPDLTSWLLESAQTLYALAAMSCTGSTHIDSDDCRWYHGSWQYLRLFDMVSSPTWHADFYAARLREEFRRGARQVLITGTADYTTLAFVLDAARQDDGTIPQDLAVHVLDLCQTPLLACQWYANQFQQQITTHKIDITDDLELKKSGLTGENGLFDLIVTDAFLTRFTEERARKVMHSWSLLLRLGGRLLTTIRLHPRNDYRTQRPSGTGANDQFRVADPTDDFELRLRERATAWRSILPINLEDLFRAGRQYAKRMRSHDLGDKGEIMKLFEEHTFRISNHSVQAVPGELVETEYLRVTATRQ
jgi:hypothetical protein